MKLSEHRCLHTLSTGDSTDYGLEGLLPLDVLSLVSLGAIIGSRGRSKSFCQADR